MEAFFTAIEKHHDTALGTVIAIFLLIILLKSKD